MEKMQKLLVVNKVQLLEKTINGRFNSAGKSEVIEKKIEVTEQQFKDVRKGASKTGIYFVLSTPILTYEDSKADLEGVERPDNPSNKRKTIKNN